MLQRKTPGIQVLIIGPDAKGIATFQLTADPGIQKLLDGSEHTVTLVGVDEADLAQGKVSWLSPVAQALMKAKVDDSVQLRTPSGVEEIEIIAIRYGVNAAPGEQ